MTNQDTCTTCGTTTGVKKDGNLWRHKNPDGIYCENVSVESARHEVTATPLVFSAEASSDKKALSIDVAEVDTSKRQKETATPKPKTDVFVFTIEVSASCPYVGEKRWESCNEVLARKKAKDAGKRPVGGAKRTNSEIVGNKRVLTYEVPVE